MTFEDVKCLGSPRTSQMPRSGSRQCVIAFSTCLHEDRPEAVGQAVARLRVQVERVEDRPPDVVLAVRVRAVADPDRLARPRSRRGGRAPTPPAARSPPIPYMIWRSCVAACDVGDEVEEVVGLPVEAERVEAPEHERGVADPRVAVVPVALAARRLGQGGRGRGDHRAGRRVRQPLQRQRATAAGTAATGGRGSRRARATRASSPRCARRACRPRRSPGAPARCSTSARSRRCRRRASSGGRGRATPRSRGCRSVVRTHLDVAALRRRLRRRCSRCRCTPR